MKKRLIAIILSSLMVVCLFSGCGGETKNEVNKVDDKEQAADKNDEITLVYAQGLGNDETENAVVNQVISDYEKKSGVKVEFQTTPFEDFRTWLTTQFSAGKGPDIYDGIIYDVSSDYSNGWLYNFVDLYEQESPYDPGKKWKDTLPESILERMYIKNDQVPGYPSSTSVVRIFYNIDLFKEAGAKVPENWAEFMDACKKLKDAGIVPFGFPNASIGDVCWLWFNNSIANQLNHDLVKELDESGNGFVELNEIVKGFDEGKVDFTSDGFQKSFELMKEFSQYWTSDFNGLNNQDALDMFIRGEVAMIQTMSTNLRKVEDGVGDSFKYEVMPVPVITDETAPNALGKSVVLGGQPDIIYCINKQLEKDDKKLEAAIDFVQYMASPEIQERFAKEIYRIPLSTSTKLPDNLSGFIITEEPLRIPFYTGINENLRNLFHRGGQQFLEGSLDNKQFGEIVNKAYGDVLGEIKTENNWSEENNYEIKK